MTVGDVLSLYMLGALPTFMALLLSDRLFQSWPTPESIAALVLWPFVWLFLFVVGIGQLFRRAMRVATGK